MVKAYIDSLRNDKAKRTRFALMVAIIAIVLFAAVFWTLRFIGITMTDEAGCGLLEHTHTEECYERVLICDIPEGEEHTHTDECYELRLICDKEEHTHTALCYPDTSADVESPEDWEATLPAQEVMTGEWARDIVAVAQSQVGYKESERNYSLEEDGTHNGYTRFGAWYGSPYAPWNAMFVSFCLNYSNVPASVLAPNAGVEAFVAGVNSNYIDKTSGEPLPGDIILLDTDGDGSADKLGIIADVYDDRGADLITTSTGSRVEEAPARRTVRFVMGDMDGAVGETVMTVDNNWILGYVHTSVLNSDYIDNTPVPSEEPEETAEPGDVRATDEPAATDAPDSTEVPEPTEEPEPIFIQRGVVDADTSTDTVIAHIVWDDDDNSYGSISVTVRLLRGATEVQTAVLNSSNNWTYAFTGLTAANNYHLEYGVPHGYSEQIDVQSGRTATWTPFTASTFTVGNVYAIVRRTGSSGSYTYKAVGATGTFSDFLENYPVIAGSNGYPLFIPDNAQWQVSARSDSYLRADAFSVGASSSEYGITRYFYLWEDGMSSSGYSFGTHTAVHDDYYSLYYTRSGDYGGTISSYRKVGTSSTATQFFMKDDLDKYGEEEDLVGVTSSSSASNYGVFVRAWASSSTTKTSSFTIYLHKQEVVDPAAPLLSHKKQIDWLGDGDANSDAGIASPTEDDYRLYLDVQGRQEPVDILFVVDLSSSMEDSDMAPGAGETFSTSVLTDNTGIILRMGTSYALTAPSSGTTVTRAALDETSQYQRWYVTEDGTYTNCFRLWNPATEKYLGYDYSSSGSGFGLTSYGYSSLFRINAYGYLVMWCNASSSDSSYSTQVFVNYSSGFTLGSSGSTSYTVSVKAISRIRAMNNFLNGVNNSGNGFVNTLLTANPYNKIAIVTFGSDENASESPIYKVDSSVLLDWSRPTTTSQTTINPNKVESGAGTNYCAGLYRLDDMLSSSLIANDGRRKLVIFLSDGSPTFALASKSATARLGNGQASDDDNAITVSDPTYEAIREVVNAAKAAHSNIQFNSIAFHNPATDSHFLQDYLQSIASRGNGAFYEATNTEELENAILSATMPRGVVIADTLSEYVDYNTDNPALKVTMTKNGVTTVLWQNGSATTAGSSIIESCAFENGQVKLDLKDDYLLQSDEVFTVSFNVKINQYAKDQYTANQGYGGMTGGYNTDYGTNTTSSFKPGFYSNTSAEVSYEIAGGYYLEEYSKPVVQTEQSDTPTPAQDATFEHNKVIDWLGDGDPNPDTQLTGDNTYRLYLDWTGEFSKPYDLMLVIDRSASMLYAPDGSTATTSNPSRETLVEYVLNGYGSDAGLIKTFLDANPQNRISIVTFGGEPEERMDISSWSSATGFTAGGIYTLTYGGYYMAASTSGTSITPTSSLTDYAKWVALESQSSGYFYLKNVATGRALNFNSSYSLYTDSEYGCGVRLYNNRLYVSTTATSQYYVYYDSSYGYIISTYSTTFTCRKANLASYSYEIDSAAPRDWGRNYNAFYLNVQENTGTNYEAGLLKAQEKWASSTNPNKLMIFLSDGEPTYWVKSNGDRGGTGGTTYSNLHGTSENGSIYESKLAWDVFHSACPTVTTRALLFGSAMNQEISFSPGFAYTFRNTSGTNLTIANNSTWYYCVESSGYAYLRTRNGSGSYLYYNGSSFSTTSSSSSATLFRLDPNTGYLQYYVSSSNTWANTSYGYSYIKAFRPLDMSALNYIDDTGVAATIESDNTGAYQALLNTLSSFIYPSDVKIVDTLSKYVSYNPATGALKVTRVNKNTGAIQVLYENGSITATGQGIIQSVVYTPGDTSMEPTASTGTITVNFVDGFVVDPTYDYTVSFNVTTTKTAENEKAYNIEHNVEGDSTGYAGVTGDVGTDFTYTGTQGGVTYNNHNTTSSTMPGFHSNDEAYVSLTLGGEDITDYYDHPVVQVEASSGSETTVENFDKAKVIDWLGDGEDNPDTDFSGEDDYRLYLDWSGEFSTPYDLLVIVDVSASMLGGVDGTSNPAAGQSREAIVESILNGQNGIINRFLNANWNTTTNKSNNSAAVIKFGGEPDPRLPAASWNTVTTLTNETAVMLYTGSNALADMGSGSQDNGNISRVAPDPTDHRQWWSVRVPSDGNGFYFSNVETGRNILVNNSGSYYDVYLTNTDYVTNFTLSDNKIKLYGYSYYLQYGSSYTTGFRMIYNGGDTFTVNQKTSVQYSYLYDAQVVHSWSNTDFDVDLNVRNDTGTNYAAGLRLAREVLQTSPHQNKIVIFLSDGEPTYWLISDTERGGTGLSSNATNVANAKTASINAANSFKAAFPNVPMYGVMFNTNSTVIENAREVLQAISTSGQAYVAESGAELLEYFNMMTSPSNMVVTDYLSQYVEFNPALGGDIKVTSVNKNTGEIVVLYEESEGGIQTLGQGVIKPGYPKYTPWNEMTADEKAAHPDAVCNGKIELQFVDGFIIDPDYRYTLSFNVHVSDEAKAAKQAKIAVYDAWVRTDPTFTVGGNTYHLFDQDGQLILDNYELLTDETNPTKAYVDSMLNLYCPEGITDTGDYIGDPGTDYSYNAQGISNNNHTSSGMPGFRSNHDATVSYTFGHDVVEHYDHPVVQVTVEGEEKPDTNFHNSKVIDWLGDGSANPDTDVDDTLSGEALEDIYRLYLDMSGKQNKGCDLMIIIDRSNSMNESAGNGMTRIDAVNRVLFGPNDNDGLLAEFLSANDGKNRICMIGFGGQRTNGHQNDANYDYSLDSNLIRGWGRDASVPQSGYITAPTDFGTDYSAALLLAGEAWEQVYTDDTNKLMIFLSDGEPSFWIDVSNGVNTTNHTAGRRYGNGTQSSINAETAAGAKATYDWFHAAFPAVHTESVGFGTSFDTNVLNYYAKNGDPNSSAVALRATDYEGLLAALKAQIYPSSIVITDALSKYVRYYSADADLKVTMKREIGTDSVTGDPIYEEATIYENGHIVNNAPVYVGGVATGDTVDGRDYIRRVSYTEGDTSAVPTSSTGTVEVEFNPEFVADPSYVFTVSFNVTVTQAAYLAENNGVAHNVGDEGTDYPGNTSSSNKMGYWSNDAASRVTYNIGSETQNDPYDKPVIQAPDQPVEEETSTGAKATVTKSWDDENDKYMLRPESIIVRLYANGQPTGKYAILSADNGWTYTWNDLPAYDDNGDLIEYSIEEDDVYAYTPVYAEPTYSTTGDRQFYVRYYPNEGTGQLYNDGPYSAASANDPITATVKPNVNSDFSFTRAGYTFTGWNTQPDGSGTSYAPGATITLNDHVKLYAQWQQNAVTTYTLTYNKNGSDVTGIVPTGGTYESGDTVTVAGKGTLARNGYTFTGWNTAANGSGTSYAPGDTLTITANTTLYAQWEVEQVVWYPVNDIVVGEQYLIGFKVGNDVYLIMNYCPNPVTSSNNYCYVYSNVYYGYVAEAVMSGNNVVGCSDWTTDLADCTWTFSSVNGGSITSTKGGRYLGVYTSGTDADMYPKDNSTYPSWVWTSSDHTLKYPYGTGYKYASYKDTVNGNTNFCYAPTSQTTSISYVQLYSQTQGSTSPTAQPTATPTASPTTTPTPSGYTVTFDANGGTLTGVSSTSGVASGTQYGNVNGFNSEPTYSDNEYTFYGWFTQEYGGTQITSTDQVTGDITLYAHWYGEYFIKDTSGVFVVDRLYCFIDPSNTTYEYAVAAPSSAGNLTRSATNDGLYNSALWYSRTGSTSGYVYLNNYQYTNLYMNSNQSGSNYNGYANTTGYNIKLVSAGSNRFYLEDTNGRKLYYRTSTPYYRWMTSSSTAFEVWMYYAGDYNAAEFAPSIMPTPINGGLKNAPDDLIKVNEPTAPVTIIEPTEPEIVPTRTVIVETVVAGAEAAGVDVESLNITSNVTETGNETTHTRPVVVESVISGAEAAGVDVSNIDAIEEAPAENAAEPAEETPNRSAIVETVVSGAEAAGVDVPDIIEPQKTPEPKAAENDPEPEPERVPDVTVTYTLVDNFERGGAYIIVANSSINGRTGYAVGNFAVSRGHYLAPVAVTVNDNGTLTVSSAVAANILWNASGTKSTGYTLHNTAAGRYMGLDENEFLAPVSVAYLWHYTSDGRLDKGADSEGYRFLSFVTGDTAKFTTSMGKAGGDLSFKLYKLEGELEINVPEPVEDAKKDETPVVVEAVIAGAEAAGVDINAMLNASSAHAQEAGVPDNTETTEATEAEPDTAVVVEAVIAGAEAAGVDIGDYDYTAYAPTEAPVVTPEPNADDPEVPEVTPEPKAEDTEAPEVTPEPRNTDVSGFAKDVNSEYELVSPANLTAGGKYLIVYNSGSTYKAVMNTIYSSYGPQFTSSLTRTASGSYYKFSTALDAYLFTLSGSAGAWKFYNDTAGYLVSSGTYPSFVTGTSTYTWSIDSNGQMQGSSGSYPYLTYSSNGYYLNSSGSSGDRFTFYRLVEDTPSGTTYEYQLTDHFEANGEYVIVYTNSGVSSAVTNQLAGTTNTLSPQSVTISSDKVVIPSGVDPNTILWKATSKSGHFNLQSVGSSSYLAVIGGYLALDSTGSTTWDYLTSNEVQNYQNETYPYICLIDGVFDVSSNVYGRVTIYKKVSTQPATTYTVTYNANGATSGSVPTDSNSPYASGATVTVLGNTGNLAKTGYNFNGWNTQANSNGTSYAQGATFTINANTTLYAQWTPITYTVSFNANGGTLTGSPSTTYAYGATYGSDTAFTSAPTRSGYTFAGWYTSATGGTQVNGSSTVTSGGVLYAHWTENAPTTYTVTFDPNGGTLTGASTATYNAGSAYNTNTAFTSAPTRSGYTFAGWYTSATGGTQVNGSSTVTGSTTLHAHWTQNSGSGEYIYQLVDHFEENGEYVIVINGKAVVGSVYNTTDNKYLRTQAVTENVGIVSIPSSVDPNTVLWRANAVTTGGASGWSLLNLAANKYMAFKGTSTSADEVITLMTTNNVPWAYDSTNLDLNDQIDSDGYYYLMLSTNYFTTSKNANQGVRLYRRIQQQETTDYTIHWHLGITNKLDRKPLELEKHIAGPTGPMLDGATFIIARCDDNWNIYDSASGHDLMLTATSTNGGQIIFTDPRLDGDGIAYGLNCLPYGKYVINETNTPEGYQGAGPWHVIVDENGARVVDDNGWEIETGTGGNYALINQPVYELPETGGAGVYAYTAVGAMLMLVPAAYLVIDRRKRKHSSN